jgi:hypothetical protein
VRNILWACRFSVNVSASLTELLIQSGYTTCTPAPGPSMYITVASVYIPMQRCLIQHFWLRVTVVPPLDLDRILCADYFSHTEMRYENRDFRPHSAHLKSWVSDGLFSHLSLFSLFIKLKHVRSL